MQKFILRSNKTAINLRLYLYLCQNCSNKEILATGDIQWPYQGSDRDGLLVEISEKYRKKTQKIPCLKFFNIPFFV